jgi:hypothetical protein
VIEGCSIAYAGELATTGWPNFTWNPVSLAAAEMQFPVDSGVFIGPIKHP